jgi:hypothetical protein
MSWYRINKWGSDVDLFASSPLVAAALWVPIPAPPALRVVSLLTALRLHETKSSGSESVRVENRSPNSDEETAQATSPSKPRESLRNKSLYISLIWKWTVISLISSNIGCNFYVISHTEGTVIVLLSSHSESFVWFFPFRSYLSTVIADLSDNNKNCVNILCM